MEDTLLNQTKIYELAERQQWSRDQTDDLLTVYHYLLHRHLDLRYDKRRNQLWMTPPQSEDSVLLHSGPASLRQLAAFVQMLEQAEPAQVETTPEQFTCPLMERFQQLEEQVEYLQTGENDPEVEFQHYLDKFQQRKHEFEAAGLDIVIDLDARCVFCTKEGIATSRRQPKTLRYHINRFGYYKASNYLANARKRGRSDSAKGSPRAAP